MRHIAGDSLEHSRIRLERDIDNNIPPPPSMSLGFASPDEDDVSSVDFPRHNSRHPSFHSFEHASHLDSDFYSRRGDDDSIALDPDLGLTMSTAAHHASALTLSAGLRGRGAYSHAGGRASPSGAEYDPDRPLQTILDNRIADGISLFDTTSHPKSQNPTRTLPSHDPLVVDSTAELDRFLRTGHRHVPLVYPYASRSHSQPASDPSESDTSPPRLAHALGHNFSPKRPRTTPAPVKDPSSNHPSKSKSPSSNLNPSLRASKHERVIPATIHQPLRNDTRKGGLKASDPAPRISRPSKFSIPQRAPFSELGNKHARIRLPDVTGLTSAVQSPAKNDATYAGVSVPVARTLDLLPALDALQSRLQALERANCVSRRRVRELEHELDECRAQVLAERTRIEERDRDRETAHARAEEETRYHTVVAEKKALEALLATLQTHLARLTEELTTHKTLLQRLRTHSGHDVRAEVHKLRMEVERLAGEVERLNVIVEEGLRERRRAKDSGNDGEGIDENTEAGENAEVVQAVPAQVGIDLTYATAPTQEPLTRGEPPTVDCLGPEPEYDELEYHHDHEPQNDADGRQDSLNDHDPVSVPQPEPVSDFVPRTQRYIHVSELARMETEICERRSERSGAQSRTPFPRIRGSNMERLFFSAPEHNVRTCAACCRRKRRSTETKKGANGDDDEEDAVHAYLRSRGQQLKARGNSGGDDDRVPPQTVLARVLRELEDDFSHYKAIYLELAEQYGMMDAASNVAKRNVLADHLRDVINILEQRGDQIASLYDLLNFEDKLIPPNAVP